MRLVGHRRRAGSRATPATRWDRARQRGAVVVEFTLVALMLVTLLAAAFDYGRAWRVGLAANEAARTGARVGSGQATILTADFSLLTGMKSALDSSGELSRVTRVVIFRSGTADGRVPVLCKTSNTSNNPCNILTGDQFRNLATSSGGGTLNAAGCIENSASKRWCPTSRINVQAVSEYLGVWVQVRYDFLFPMLGSSKLVERTAVMRLEPKDN